MKTRQYKLELRFRPFHPDLEEALLEDVRESRLKDPLGAEWFLVPSRNLRRRLRQLLSEAGIPTFNLRFVLFPDLAAAILARSPEAARKTPVPRGADRLILEGLGRGLGSGSWFAPILEHGGFLGALERTIGDLFHAGVDPDRFRAALAADATRGVVEVAGIYESVGRRFHDLEMEPVAVRILRSAGSASRLPDGPVRIYGFYDLNGAQRALIRALAATRSITAYVPRVTGDAGGWVKPHLEWLASIGFSGADPGPAGPDEGSEGRPLRWFSAAGERREAEEVVRRILDLLRSGVRPDRVAALYRDADPYADLLLRLFDRAGIPAESADRSPLSRTRPARALRLLVQAGRSNCSRRDVLDFFDAAAPLSPMLPEALALAIVARWEAWTLDAGITRGRDVWTRRLARLSDRLDRRDDGEGGSPRIDPLDREALNRLRRLVPPFLDSLVGLPAETTWSGLTRRLLDLGESWLSRGESWDDVREAVLEIGRLDAIGEPASLGAFETILEERLGALEIRGEEPDRAGVFVGGTMAARGLSFDHVFIVGLTEKVFPRPPQRDPLLPDAVRIRIRGVEGAPALRRDSVREEAFLFALALESGTNRTLSWSRIEPAEARPRLPSAFLLDAVSRHRRESLDYTGLDETTERIPLDRLVPAGEVGRAAPEDPVPRDPARFIDAGNAIDAAEFDRLLVAAASGAGRLDRLAGLRSPNLERSVGLHLSRWRSPFFTAADGFIRSEPARMALGRLIGRDRAWSASRLEKYAACPFRFFIENILGVERLEPPETLDRITALERGSLTHAILRRFLAAHGDRLRPAPREELHRELAAAARIEMTRLEAETPVGYPLTWRVDADRLLDDLSAWLDFEIDRSAGLTPRAFELAFGTRSADPGDVDTRSTRAPVPLEIPGFGSVAFQGRIDRVDVSADGSRARVTDYKTGRKPDAAVEIGLEGGLHLQLPIYLLALRAFFPDVRRAEAEYLFLGDDPKCVAFVAPDYPEPGAALPETLGVLLSGITEGRFFAYPGKKSGCDPCRYGSICGLRIEDRFALKRTDPAIAGHLRLRGEEEDA